MKYFQALLPMTVLSAGLAQAAEPTDWCAVASQYAQPSPQSAKLLEFVSGGHVFHSLRGRKTLTPGQVEALNDVLARMQGLMLPVTKRADIERWLYV